tara:strand:- start:3267 stop:3587 length:321 start_codon:yes stop_codon:yes gene_type:complete
MKISTTKALSALLQAGLITGFSSKTETRGSITETVFKVEGDLSVEHEIYGKNAQMYIIAKSPEIAKEAGEVLKESGVATIYRGWCPDYDNTFAFDVSYFKGQRWWE